MSAVRLFFGAAFISSEFTDISFEVETVLCLDFYAFGVTTKDEFIKTFFRPNRGIRYWNRQ